MVTISWRPQEGIPSLIDVYNFVCVKKTFGKCTVYKMIVEWFGRLEDFWKVLQKTFGRYTAAGCNLNALLPLENIYLVYCIWKTFERSLILRFLPPEVLQKINFLQQNCITSLASRSTNCRSPLKGLLSPEDDLPMFYLWQISKTSLVLRRLLEGNQK